MASSNCTIVDLTDGRQVCLSYGVPVAAFIPGRGYLKTDLRYSVTSSKHANAYVQRSANFPVDIASRTIPHAEFLTLIAPLGGK